jgi:hypothetical protein
MSADRKIRGLGAAQNVTLEPGHPDPVTAEDGEPPVITRRNTFGNTTRRGKGQHFMVIDRPHPVGTVTSFPSAGSR